MLERAFPLLSETTSGEFKALGRCCQVSGPVLKQPHLAAWQLPAQSFDVPRQEGLQQPVSLCKLQASWSCGSKVFELLASVTWLDEDDVKRCCSGATA
eukprot:368714-Pelagomonas_calceolata.AAC.1